MATTVASQITPKRIAPVQYWAFFGVVCLAFIVYVIFQWVTGPYFKTVPIGPTPLPGYMKIAIRGWEIGGTLAAIFTYYWVVWRPWLKSGHVTTDGVIVLAASVLWFQDPLSNYLGYWFTYNSYFINWGSWVNEVPGWNAGGTPGATIVEPLFWVIPFYIYGWLPWIIFGGLVLKWSHGRWPHRPVYFHMLMCWLVTGLLDIVAEGLLFIPLGFFQYGGSTHLAIFPEAYHKWPLLNIFYIGWLSAGMSWLRYYRNDLGETLVESGITNLKVSAGKKLLLRVLAMIGGTQLIFIIFNIVVSFDYGAHTARWPDDTLSRSYLTNGICGAGTDRLCDGPNIPKFQGPNTVRVTPEGQLHIPEGVQLPAPVPFSTEAKGPFEGRVF